MRRHGCGACHSIPGIEGARGIVGPPLDRFGSRTYVAGTFPNLPATLVAWIMDPPGMRPDTAMPDMDVGEGDARDIAAYLYTLR
jgi:cytochrome c1